MAERVPMHQQSALDPQLPFHSQTREDMLACVTALGFALALCLPGPELFQMGRPYEPSPQIGVDTDVKKFMTAAKKLQLYFIGLQNHLTKAETLHREIALMEEELIIKAELIKKHESLIQGWRKELKDQLDKHNLKLGSG